MESENIHNKREIEQSEARDKLAKVLAGMVPLGSSAYELITTIVVPLHEKKKREFLNDLAERLKKLEDEGKIDYQELAESEEFNTIITKAILLAQQNHQEEKMEALRNVVLNASVKLPKEVAEFDDLNYFLRIIEEITPLHILLLKTFEDPKMEADKRGVEFGNMMTSSSKNTLFKIYPDLKPKGDFIKIYWKELYDYALVKTDSLYSMVTGEAALNSLTTPLGNKFLEMIESEE